MGAANGGGKQLLVSAAAEQDLLSQVLHDVAQPLTVLCTVLEEATCVAEPAEQAELLALARRECERAIAAVRQLQKRPAGRVHAPAHNRKAIV